MKKALTFLGIAAFVLAIAAGAVVGFRLGAAQKKDIADLRARAGAAERQVLQLRQRLDSMHGGSAGPVVQAGTQLAVSAAPAADVSQPTEAPKDPNAPILVNAMRDVLVSVDQCVLTTRTLRCGFSVTNQSAAEKKFILAVGGKNSRFEREYGGASIFDDIGNDFLSAGGGIGNHEYANCDEWSTCEVEKTMTPNVETAGWLRFDGVEPGASTVKLLRLKWSDGQAWVPMDFRNIPIARPAG